jgi:hypothetical protein
MDTITTTIIAKTYKATLEANGTCVVRGLHAHLFVGLPNNTRALDRQRELREEVQAALYKALGPDAYVFQWTAA